MQDTKNQIVFGNFLHVKTPVFPSYRVVGHPALRFLRKCENQIFVQVGLCRLQRLMGKLTSPRQKNSFLIYDSDFSLFFQTVNTLFISLLPNLYFHPQCNHVNF